MVFEASGVDEAADGVAGEVCESQGDAAQVLEAYARRFGGAGGGRGGGGRGIPEPGRPNPDSRLPRTGAWARCPCR